MMKTSLLLLAGLGHLNHVVAFPAMAQDLIDSVLGIP